MSQIKKILNFDIIPRIIVLNGSSQLNSLAEIQFFNSNALKSLKKIQNFVIFTQFLMKICVKKYKQTLHHSKIHSGKLILQFKKEIEKVNYNVYVYAYSTKSFKEVYKFSAIGKNYLITLNSFFHAKELAGLLFLSINDRIFDHKYEIFAGFNVKN